MPEKTYESWEEMKKDLDSQNLSDLIDEYKALLAENEALLQQMEQTFDNRWCNSIKDVTGIVKQ